MVEFNIFLEDKKSFISDFLCYPSFPYVCLYLYIYIHLSTYTHLTCYSYFSSSYIQMQFYYLLNAGTGHAGQPQASLSGDFSNQGAGYTYA